MIIWIIAIVAYLIIAGLTWQFIVKKWDNPAWENIMISLSWIYLIPLYGIKNYKNGLAKSF